MLSSPRLSVPPSLVWLLSDHNQVVVTTISNFIIHTAYFKKRPSKEQVLLPSMHMYIAFPSSPRNDHVLLNLTQDRVYFLIETAGEFLSSNNFQTLHWHTPSQWRLLMELSEIGCDDGRHTDRTEFRSFGIGAGNLVITGSRRHLSCSQINAAGCRSTVDGPREEAKAPRSSLQTILTPRRTLWRRDG